MTCTWTLALQAYLSEAKRQGNHLVISKFPKHLSQNLYRTYILFHCTHFLFCLWKLEFVFANLSVGVSWTWEEFWNEERWVWWVQPNHYRSTYSAFQWSGVRCRSPSSHRLRTHCPPLSVSVAPPPTDSSISWSEPTAHPFPQLTSVAWHLSNRKKMTHTAIGLEAWSELRNSHPTDLNVNWTESCHRTTSFTFGSNVSLKPICGTYQVDPLLQIPVLGRLLARPRWFLRTQSRGWYRRLVCHLEWWLVRVSGKRQTQAWLRPPIYYTVSLSVSSHIPKHVWQADWAL